MIHILLNSQLTSNLMSISPPHMANSSWFFDRSQSWAHFQNHLKAKVNNFLPCGLEAK